MNGNEVSLALIATLGGILSLLVGGLVWLLKKQFIQNDKTIREGNAANLKLSTSIDKLAKASEEQIRVAREQDAERRKFEKYVITKLDSIDEKADRNYDATIKNQTVQTQNVETQVVTNEIVQEKS